MGQEGGEIWTGQALLQPISFKPDRLLVRVNPKVLPGHGLMKEVSVAARQFRLEAQLA